MTYQYQNHLRTCGYCQKEKEKDHKAKLAALGHMIKRARPLPANKGASSYSYSDSHSDSKARLTLRRYPISNERQKKLKELVRLIRSV